MAERAFGCREVHEESPSSDWQQPSVEWYHAQYLPHVLQPRVHSIHRVRPKTLHPETLQWAIRKHWLEPKPSVRPKKAPAQRAGSSKLGPCQHADACALLPPPRVTKAVVEPMPLPTMRTARRAAQASCKRITPASPTGSRQIGHGSSFCTSSKAHRVQHTKLIPPPEEKKT